MHHCASCADPLAKWLDSCICRLLDFGETCALCDRRAESPPALSPSCLLACAEYANRDAVMEAKKARTGSYH